MAANTMVSPQTQTFTKGPRLSSLPMQDEMLRTGFSMFFQSIFAGTCREADATLFWHMQRKQKKSCATRLITSAAPWPTLESNLAKVAGLVAIGAVVTPLPVVSSRLWLDSLDISRSWCHLMSLGVTSASKPLVCIVALCSWDPLGYALVVPWLCLG